MALHTAGLMMGRGLHGEAMAQTWLSERLLFAKQSTLMGRKQVG